MKAFIQKIFYWLKSLFLRLRVILTLQFGREDKVEPEAEESQSADSEDESK